MSGPVRRFAAMLLVLLVIVLVFLALKRHGYDFGMWVLEKLGGQSIIELIQGNGGFIPGNGSVL